MAGDAGGRGRRVMKVADLRPNPVNAGVFTSSLGDESIRRLADDMDHHGLRQPIEVRPDGTILNGHRRWLAVRLLGWDEVDAIVVGGVDGAEDVEGYVLDAFATTRDATVEERVRVFELALRVLRARHGRGRGRPSKIAPNGAIFLSEAEIESEAARIAGFGSATTARRAAEVIGSGDADLIRAVIAGELSIGAANDRLVESRKAEEEAAGDGQQSGDDAAGTGDAGSAADDQAASDNVQNDDDPDGSVGDDPGADDAGGPPGPPEHGDDGDDGDDDGDDGDDEDDEDPSDEDDDADSDPGDDDNDGQRDADDDDAAAPAAGATVPSPSTGAVAADSDPAPAAAVTPNAAFAALLAYVVDCSPEVAVKVVRKLASRAGLECWVAADDGDPAEAVSDLLGRLTRHLDRLAADDLDEARALAWKVEDAVREVLMLGRQRAQPQLAVLCPTTSAPGSPCR